MPCSFNQVSTERFLPRKWQATSQWKYESLTKCYLQTIYHDPIIIWKLNEVVISSSLTFSSFHLLVGVFIFHLSLSPPQKKWNLQQYFTSELAHLFHSNTPLYLHPSDFIRPFSPLLYYTINIETEYLLRLDWQRDKGGSKCSTCSLCQDFPEIL